MNTSFFSPLKKAAKTAAFAVAITIAAAVQTANAQSVTALRDAIIAHGLTASAPGDNTVTVTGTTTANTMLTLNISSGVTVVWEASLTGTTASSNSLNPLKSLISTRT